MCRITILRLVFGAIVCSAAASAQTVSLQASIDRTAAAADGHVGTAIFRPEGFDTVLVHGADRFPMQSVFKFPLALTVLNRVDSGRLALDMMIHVNKSEMLENTWSPLREKYPNRDFDITLDELLRATVAQSDNNGCDILFRLLGGPDVVNQYIHTLGITDISIVATEEEMHRDWDVQYRNYSTPRAMAHLLSMFDSGSILSSRSREYLWRVMAETSTGGKRLKGLLPGGTVVAHKTGSSGTNETGIAAATNDVGIVVLPNGTHVVIVAFLSDSRAGEAIRDGVIAEIARVAWDAYTRHGE